MNSVRSGIYLLTTISSKSKISKGRRDRMVVEFITTYAISAIRMLYAPRSEVHSIRHYAIQFVSDLRQVGGFFLVLWFHSPPRYN